jgi:hypothetical protein
MYHKGFIDTNWIMVVYNLIHGTCIKVNLISIISLQNYMSNRHAYFTPHESYLATWTPSIILY